MKQPTVTRPESDTRKDGIVVSTVVRLTTSDGRAFDEVEKALQHEAFYRILKTLVKAFNWADDEETAKFALLLAKSYPQLLPVLSELQKEAQSLSAKLQEHARRS